MLLPSLLSLAFASEPNIELALRVAGFAPGADEADVPVDTVPVVAFEATARTSAVVRLVDDTSGEALVEEEHTFDPGFTLVELDAGAPFAPGAAYRVEIDAERSVGKVDEIRFTVGEGLAEPVAAPEMAENQGVALSFYDGFVNGLLEVRVDGDTADRAVVLLLDEAGALAGVGFPEAGEDVESLDVRAAASEFRAEACFTAVTRDRAGRESEPAEEACVPVEDGRGLSCSSAPGPVGALLVALGAVAAAARRRREGPGRQPRTAAVRDSRIVAGSSP